MGKQPQRTTPKRRLDTTPIKFPSCEGPIAAAWRRIQWQQQQQQQQQQQRSPSSDHDGDHDNVAPTNLLDDSATLAAFLIHDASIHPKDSDEAHRQQPLDKERKSRSSMAFTTSGDDDVLEVQHVIQTISQANHIHEQLQTLQAYRSKILQKRNRSAVITGVPVQSSLEAPSPEGQPSDHRTKIDDGNKANMKESCLLPYLLLFRILLEWMLSSEVPVTLRRAIASCLVALIEFLEPLATTDSGDDDGYEDTQTKMSLPTILGSVFESLVYIPADAHDKATTCDMEAVAETISGSGSTFDIALTPSKLVWVDPLHSLQEGLSWTPLEQYIIHRHCHQSDRADSLLTKMLHFLGHQVTLTTTPSYLEKDVEDQHVHCVNLANLINKSLLLSMDQRLLTITAPDAEPLSASQSTQQSVMRMQEFLWNCLACTVMPVDCWSTIGIAYGRALQWEWQQCQAPAIKADDCSMTTAPPCRSGEGRHEFVLGRIRDIMASVKNDIPWDLNRAAAYQGLTAVVPFPSVGEVSVPHDDGTADVVVRSVIVDLMTDCHSLLIEASDPDVRLSALKSIRSLVSRISTWNEDKKAEIRSSSAATPRLDGSNHNEWIHPVIASTVEIVLQAWENPPTRKLANAIPPLFESLIHVYLRLDGNDVMVGDSSTSTLIGLVQRLLRQPKHRKGRYLALETLLPVTGASTLIQSAPTLLSDLLNGVSDKGSNTGVIATLWAKLLHQLRMEQLQEDTVRTSAASTQAWLDAWVPSLSLSLVKLELSRRKQVAAFCLPRIAAMVNATSQADARSIPHEAFSSILRHVAALRPVLNDSRYYPSHHRETVVDRILWAELEVIRYASIHGLLKSSASSEALRLLLPTIATRERLKWALTHFSPPIRIAALQVVEHLAPLYGRATEAPLTHAQRELDLWRNALPFLVKEDGKEHVTSILHCLILFLDRLSLVEASEMESVHNASSPSILPILVDFVAGFLVTDLVVNKAGYPGTVAKKESFVFSLLECVIVFSCREHPLAIESKIMPKSGSVFRRRRLDLEITTLVEIQKCLLSHEVFSTLLSLLHSNWDNTRASAFLLLVSLVQLSEISSLALPKEYAHSAARTMLESKGTFLASSPRQREADTGTRILAFLFRSMVSPNDKITLLSRLIALLGTRLTEMKVKLAAILANDIDILGGRELPLSHGIIQSMRLMMENDTVFSHADETGTGKEMKILLDCMCSHLFQALRLSLAVVADVSAGESVEGMDEEIALSVHDDKQDTYSKPINPGAIGANGIFSSVDRSTDEEKARLLASQRIVIGSWLLTKETCGALSALLELSCFETEVAAYSEAGKLLISTLTSLKHTGAAFAAHRAIQGIARVCFKSPSSSSIHRLPTVWAERLQVEVAKCDKIRDSTLRRSTGYALGFLGAMKAEVSSKSQRPLCSHLMISILQLSLPPEGQANSFMDQIGLSKDFKKSLLPSVLHYAQFALAQDSAYSLRTRVHALNTLRAILLDASLSREVFPFVGFAMIASVMGYVDSEWSIRNSSTLVFAAAMGRSIDPDKNASNSDLTGSIALTAQELFQAYPTLPTFLLAVLTAGVQGIFTAANTGMSLPPVLPILLLLTRIQSVSKSGQESVALVEPFVPIVLQCLQDKQISIRKGAARALRNMSSSARNSTTSLRSILQSSESCLSNLNSPSKATGGNSWNQVHGSLLAINELAEDSLDAKTMIRESNLFDSLCQISTVINARPNAPPICIAVAIQILWTLANGRDQRDILSRCVSIVSWVESFTDSIGSAELSVTASSIATRSINATIWDSSGVTGGTEQCLDMLSAMFCSNLVDVRIASVKVFKKAIYDGIDCVMASPLGQDVIAKVGMLLLSCIENEMGRNRDAHPPTLRRLLRCLLETLQCGVPSRAFYLQQDFYAQCHALSASILAQAGAFETNTATRCTLTSLHGYCAELLSISLLEMARTEGDHNNLTVAIGRLSDPSLHWRLRHSAAVALRGYDVAPATTGQGHTSLELLRAWIGLMQDDDVDVRYAAAQAIQPANHHHSSCRHQVKNVTSELLLVREFPLLRGSRSREDWTCVLLSILVESTANLEDQLDTVIHELDASVNSAPHDTLPSLEKAVAAAAADGCGRSIFEEEKPNSYHEICLIGQLCVMELCQDAVLEQVATGQVSALHNLCDRLWNQLHAVLCKVWAQARSLSHTLPPGLVNVAFDVTRHHYIFAPLHTLLVGAIATIHQGLQGDDAFGSSLLSKVRQVVDEMMASSSSSTFHPLIYQALRTLSMAQTAGCPATSKSLRLCCFLLVPDEEHTRDE